MNIRIALAQLNMTVGDLAGNRRAILEAGAQAAALGADLMLTPELALTGYPPEDLLLRPDFLRDCHRELDLIAAAAPLATLVGAPWLEAERVTNAAVLVGPGAPAGARYDKQALPNYGVFDEERVFASGARSLRLDHAASGARMAVTICEDLWLADGPAARAVRAGANIVLNLSASPYHLGKPAAREQMLRTRARDGLAFVAYCNLVGGQDELVFDGRSVVIGPDGEVIARARADQPELLVADLDLGRVLGARLGETRLRRAAFDLREDHHQQDDDHDATAVRLDTGAAPVPQAEAGAIDGAAVPLRLNACAPAPAPEGDAEELWGALRLGLRDYVAKNGFPGVILGLSGGIDSALVATLAADALGPERVRALSLPTRFNSEATRDDARRIAEALGIGFRELPIGDLHGAVGDLMPELSGLAAENVQARLRGLVLMALSNQDGPLLLACSNKSETAVGYATLYGDTAGGFSPIKDLPKTTVFALALFVNARAGRELIPASVIERPPSAELADGQADTDSLPPYEVLDAVLEAYVEADQGPEAIAASGVCDLATARRISTMVDRAEHKRRQAAPGIRCHRKAFGRDRRLPITRGG